MRRTYNLRLLGKLEGAWKRARMIRGTRVYLSKWELQDLSILWKEEAIKKWGLMEDRRNEISKQKENLQ